MSDYPLPRLMDRSEVLAATLDLVAPLCECCWGADRETRRRALVSRSDDFFFAYYGHTDIRGQCPIDAGPAAAIKALAERSAALGVEVRSALDREPDCDPGPDADE